jgi:hypothetical protein
MSEPETGLWGPGDFPADFVTIDDLLRKVIHLNRTTPKNEWHTEHFQMGERAAVRNAILDLAEDLDERGLVLVPHIPLPAGVSFAELPDGTTIIAHPDFPPHVWDGDRMVPLDCYPVEWKTVR